MSYCELCKVNLSVSESFAEWMKEEYPHFELNADSDSHYRHGMRDILIGNQTLPEDKYDKKTVWKKEDEIASYCIFSRVGAKQKGNHVRIDKFIRNADKTFDHHSIVLCECKPAEIPERVVEAQAILQRLSF